MLTILWIKRTEGHWNKFFETFIRNDFYMHKQVIHILIFISDNNNVYL